MTPENTANTTKTVQLKVVDMKPKQKVFNLDTNEDGFELEVRYQQFTVPEYDQKKGGWYNGKEFVEGTKDEFDDAVFAAASSLIQPRSAQVVAFIEQANRNSYQSGKQSALATGNFVTPELRGKVVQVMRLLSTAYADMSAKDTFDKWKAGYLAGKSGAIRVLSMAQETADDLELD